jgi:Ca2+-binding EF-hand superfamily protein
MKSIRLTNDLDTTSKSPSVNPSSSPTSAGQNRDTGNDMVSPNGTQGTMKQSNATRPDFDTLDKKGKGSLSAADIKGNQWLSKNFSRCDSNHDGTLSREEYNNCH